MEEQKLKSKFPGAPGDPSVKNWSLLEIARTTCSLWKGPGLVFQICGN